ncbi:MAG: response regulator [Burkholderiaceae bacterium]|nr:response regulator [Burkholderiaceae bacterium]
MSEGADPAALRLALAAAEQRLQAVAEVAGGPLGTLVFALDDSGQMRLTSADAAARRILHDGLAAGLGRPLRELFPVTEGAGLHDALCEVVRSGRALPPRALMLSAGHSGLAHTAFAFAAAPGQVVLKFWENAGHDEARDAARHNQALLSQILQNSPVAVALTREDGGTIVDVNTEWTRLTGYARHEALGRTTIELGFWRDTGDRARSLSPLQDRGVVRNPESLMHTRDGRYVVTAMHGSRVEIGGVRHILVYLLDMTARQQAEEALRQLNAELESRVTQRTAELAQARDEAERASRVKSEFLSGMSHELRTPLNAILGFGQLLQAGTALAPRERRFVREILRAGEHLLELINEVLDLARIESGKLPISLEPVALDPLVDECLSLLRPLAAERQITLAEPVLAPGSVVLADRTRVRQVLLNLLSNALKYNHDGGRVALACVDEGERWRIDVSDTGPGLSEAQQRRLFQDFERLDADRSGAQGTGIGLALSRRLVQMMGGEIGVLSHPDQGSTFWFRLPRAAAPQAALPAAAAAEPAAVDSGGAPPRPCRLLYIEDNPANALLVAEMLASRPHIALRHAPLPELGLQMARAEPPDLILLDIQLPGVDGYEVLRRLRADKATRAIPVLALSANAMRSDVERGLAAGFVNYLAKPLDLRLLLAVVDGLLPP